MAEKIRLWYQQGLWSADMVRRAFEKGVLNEEEYREIMGA